MRENATVRRGVRLAVVALSAVLLVGVGGCDDDTVFVDKPPFDQPSETTNNFLGYVSPVDAKQTSCGNCHATFQSGWSTTGHYDAWEGLQSSGHAQEVCEGCHTVSQLGNALTDPAGYNLVKDQRYTDVQCESCHGSGWDHANAPTTVQPLASIAVDTALTNGCGECHFDSHHPFVEQWRASRHSNLSVAQRRSPECNECHEGRTALEVKFAGQGDYVEKFDPDAIQPIVCVVCHSPHGSEYDANLRAPIQTSTLSHLCVRCHSRQGTPPSSRGPHAAQGLLVQAEDVGWIAPDTDLPSTNAHGSPANPKVCVTCHVAMYEVADDATGEFLVNNVGHRFEAIPCLDAQGIPTDGPCDDDDRDFSACAVCHGSESAALDEFEDNRAEIDSLLAILWLDTNGDLEMALPDAGLLPQVVAGWPPDELDPRDQVITTAEGAMWNALLAYNSTSLWWDDFTLPNGAHVRPHKSSGDGVHNPELLRELLTSSIGAVEAFYGLQQP